MADQAQELRRIHWREVFSFTHLFGSFRLSRHMTKVLIALLGVVLTWTVGRSLDLVFAPFSEIYVTPAGAEPEVFWRADNFAEWKKALAAGDVARVQTTAASLGKSPSEADIKKSRSAVVASLRQANLKALKDSYAAAGKDDALRRAANARWLAADADIDALQPQGPFDVFITAQGEYFRQAVSATIRGNILGGLDRVAPQPTRGAMNFAAEPPGLVASLANMVRTVAWLAWQHWLFAILFFLAVLLIWSFCGGAIARAAALQATRDEKAGLGECFRFACRRFFSFFFSPVLPVAIFLVMGLLGMVVVSLPGMIPGFGGVWIGLTFWIALVLSVVMAFLLIGLLAGGVLMAPTIAVEGSDTFDACTRSYAFVLSRPWRAAFYGLVAAAYGAICYLFVRFLLFLVLLIAHGIVGVFAGLSRPDVGSDKWRLMWSGPTFEDLQGTVSPLALQGGLNGADWFGGWMVWCWVALVSAVLVAWVISYAISASTYIYLLLRKAEDATDLDEVYIEEPEEELPAPAAENAPAGANAPTASPAGTPTPADALPASSENAPPPSAGNEPPSGSPPQP